jgi:stage II sporulation protein D
MKEMRRDPGKVFDVESTQKDQVYLGLDRTDSKGAQLVARTHGMILVAKNSKTNDPIKAFYHASCGGETQLPEQVWGSHFAGFTKRATCPYCTSAPSFHWDYQISFHDIETHLWRNLLVDAKARANWPVALWHDPRRWILMGMTTDHSALKDAHANQFIFDFADRSNLNVHAHASVNAYVARNWFDPTKLKSTLFTMQTVGRSIVFHGKGSGHGVGMCQWGAKRMGELGFTREEILTQYYPGVKLARLW